MERAVDRMFMTLLISLDPFLHRRIAENKVGVAHDRKTKLSDFSRMAGGIKGVFPGSSNHESLSRRTSIAAPIKIPLHAESHYFPAGHG